MTFGNDGKFLKPINEGFPFMAKKQDQLPEMQIEYWAIDRLIPYARNPRKNDDAVPKMAGLIKEFGFKVPIVARSDGEVIDGHLRLKAAHKLGLKEVPVVLADEWTPAQVKAFRLAVNKSAEWAEWDEELLKLELDELKLDDFDLPLIGFDDALQDKVASDIIDKEYKEELAIIVECDSETEQEKLFEEFQNRGLRCRVQSL